MVMSKQFLLAAMVPILSLLMAPDVDVMANSGATSYYKVGIMPTSLPSLPGWHAPLNYWTVFIMTLELFACCSSTVLLDNIGLAENRWIFTNILCGWWWFLALAMKKKCISTNVHLHFFDVIQRTDASERHVLPEKLSGLPPVKIILALKQKSCHDANTTVNGDTRGCHIDNLRCHQWLQSWHHDISLIFSIIWHVVWNVFKYE